jgi:hypothetical protein
MANYTTGVVNRMQSVMRASDALMDYDTEHRIEAAQMQEFEEGIKVANDVMAEFIADLSHLCDYHGQDFPSILDAAAEKYLSHKREGAAES